MTARTLVLALLATALGSAPAAAAQGGIDSNGRLELHMGERAVVHIGEDGRLVLDSLSGVDPGDVMGPGEPRPLGHFTLVLGAVSGLGTVLRVDNGYETPFNYSAVMYRGAGGGRRTSRTSVCTLQPHIFSMENWPYALDGVVVGDFTKAEDGQMVCR